jgi:hypothetical protein
VAPGFTLAVTADQKLSPSELSGRPVVLAFGAKCDSRNPSCCQSSVCIAAKCFASRRLRVKSSNALIEHMFSGFTPKADIPMTPLAALRLAARTGAHYGPWHLEVGRYS